MANSKYPTEDYQFCYLLLGKTGVGKSTTGNRILGIRTSGVNKKPSTDIDDLQQHRNNLHQTSMESTDTDALEFKEREGSVLSTTKVCKFMGNKRLKCSVLDVRGFSDSEYSSDDAAKVTQRGGVGEGKIYNLNLSILREVYHMQTDYNLVFNRVIYFLPERGVPGTLHASLQEEIKVLYKFFGLHIFKSMIIAITTDWQEWTTQTIDEKSTGLHSHMQELLAAAFKKLKVDYKDCPPLLYINKTDSGEDLRKKLESANVKNKSGIKLEFKQDICVKCGGSIRFSDENKTNRIELKESNSDERKKYEESKCHPAIIPKYTTVKRHLGSVLYVTTFGISSQFGAPGFNDKSEICISCNEPPESRGCCAVLKHFSKDGWKGEVDHSNVVEQIRY